MDAPRLIKRQPSPETAESPSGRDTVMETGSAGRLKWSRDTKRSCLLPGLAGMASVLLKRYGKEASRRTGISSAETGSQEIIQQKRSITMRIGIKDLTMNWEIGKYWLYYTIYGARSARPGSEGSEGKVSSPCRAGGYVRLTAAGCVERLCSLTLKGTKVKRFLRLTGLWPEGSKV